MAAGAGGLPPAAPKKEKYVGRIGSAGLQLLENIFVFWCFRLLFLNGLSTTVLLFFLFFIFPLFPVALILIGGCNMV